MIHTTTLYILPGERCIVSQRTVDDVMRPAHKIDGHDLRRTVASTRRFTTIKYHIGFQSGTQTHKYYKQGNHTQRQTQRRRERRRERDPKNTDSDVQISFSPVFTTIVYEQNRWIGNLLSLSHTQQTLSDHQFTRTFFICLYD